MTAFWHFPYPRLEYLTQNFPDGVRYVAYVFLFISWIPTDANHQSNPPFLRLLFVTPEYQNAGGGISTFYENLLPALVSQGHEVHVMVGSAFRIGERKYVEDGVMVEWLRPELFEKHLSGFSRYSIMPELQRHLAAAWALYEQAGLRKSFDAVEVVDWGLLFVPWVLASDELPVVVQLHASTGQIDWHDPDLQRPLQYQIVREIERNLLPLASARMTLSYQNQRYWEERLGANIDYCPPAYLAAPETTDLIDTSNKVAFGFCAARIQYWKGPVVLCEALRLLGRDAPQVYWAGRDTRYSIASKTTSMSQYLTDIFPDVVDRKLFFLGQLSRREVMSRMSAARFGVVPSLWDVYNYSAVEMMGLRKPVIISEGAGASDIVQSGANGFLAATGNSVDLAEQLTRVQHLDAREITEIGRESARTVAVELAPSVIAGRRIKHFEDLVKRSGAPKVPDEWSRNLVEPSTSGSLEDSLEDIPMRSLAEYLRSRVSRKIKKKFFGNGYK